MKQIILSCCLSIFYLSVNGQTTTSIRSAPLDTNKIVYDEQGNALRYYQYIKLLNTGEYTITSNGEPGKPRVKSYLKKLNSHDKARIYAIFKERTAIQSPMLRVDSILNIKPLLGKIKKSDLDRKAIILIFWDTNCAPCTDSFSDINNFFEHLPDKTDVVLIAITPDDEAIANEKLKQKPLKYARFENDAMGTINTYQIENYPDYVITDKDHVIRYASSGSSPITITMIKDTIDQVLK